MKKLVTILFLAVVTTVASAQQKSAVASDAKNKSESWAKAYNLTEDQKTKVNNALLPIFTERQAVLDAYKVDKDAAKKDAALAKVKESLKTEMKKIMDAKQYANWEKEMANRPMNKARVK